MGYPLQDTTDDFPALPIPPKKQPTGDDFPILKKKDLSPVLKSGGQVGTSVPQLEPDARKLKNLSDISVSGQQQQDIKNYLIATDKEHKAKVNDAINTTTDLYRAAVKFHTGKENEFQNGVPNEQKGEYVNDFLNNPNVIERAKSDPAFAKQYKEAKFNRINDFPETANKEITQKVGQYIEDNMKHSILYHDPSKKEADQAVDALVKSGDLDEHQAYKYKQDIRPHVGTIKSVLFGSPIPTSTYVNTISKSLERSGGNILEGMRDAADKISLGTISKFGEDRAAHQKRVLNDIYSEPQIESQASEGNKFGMNIADMVGFALPAVLGEMAGVPAMATLGTQFYGQNKKDGMVAFPDNENKQDAYAALTTGIDLIAGEKLPIKGLGQSIRGLVDEAAAGKISQAAAKNKYLGFITDTFKGGLQGANALEIMKVGHNAANAVFGGSDFNVVDQAKQVLKDYPQDALGMAFFSGIHAAMGLKGKQSQQIKQPENESTLQGSNEKMGVIEGGQGTGQEIGIQGGEQGRHGIGQEGSQEGNAPNEKEVGVNIIRNNTWYRGVNKNNESAGDKFFSTDESTAGDYAINKVGEKPTMTKLTEAEHPKNPLVVGTKEDLADKIGFPEEDIYDLKGNFDQKAKEYAQPKGHDAIVYESGSFDNPELHLFEKSKSPPPTNTEIPEAAGEQKPRIRVTAEQLERVQPEKPPITPIEPNEAGNAKLTGITHEETQRTREEFGLGEPYQKTKVTDEEVYNDAENEIRKGYNVNKLIEDLEGGDKRPNPVETTILKIYKANLEAQIEKDPSDQNLAQLKRLVQATDIVGSQQGREFRARQGGELRDDSFAGFFMNEIAANNDAPLTEHQKEIAKTDYQKLKGAQEAADKEEAKLKEAVNKQVADQEVKKAAKTTKRTKKTHEDFVKERKEILNSAREALKKARGQTSATIVPYANELVAIAPHVLKMVKSLAEEGVNKLEDVVKRIHEEFKGDVPQLTEKDVHNIIAREYTEKRGTRKEAAIVAENLRIEAQRINKLERLKNGEQPKNEKAKQGRNQEISKVSKEIASFRRENPDYEGKLKQLAERNKKETEKIKEKIAKGEFDTEDKSIPLLQQKELQKQFPQEFLKAQRSQDALIEARHEIALRRAKQMYENKSSEEKMIDMFAKTLNVPRTLMASMDFSAPLRQGIVASIAHPKMASQALRFMFEAAKDEKVYNRWLDMVHKSDRWEGANKTDLGITDPESLHLKEHEEAYQGAPYAEKIPIVGLGVKASERAYVGYLNHLRWNLYNMYADRFEAQGKTFENHPELYRGISSFINSSTGRGNLEGKMKSAAPLLNAFLFASKLMASRINMLGLSDIPNLAVRAATLGKRGLDYGFYTKLPKEIRVEAIKDMLKFVGVGTSILMTAKMMGAQVENDPRSSDFGKIHVGNTRWDIWGGFQPYARVLTQFVTGERKAATSGQIQELNGKGFMGQSRATPLESFFRTKLAPVPGAAWNLISGRDVTGQPVTLRGQLIQNITPLLAQDIYQGMKDQGVRAVFTVGIPSAFGVGVQTYSPNQYGGGQGGGSGAKGTFKKEGKHKKQSKK